MNTKKYSIYKITNPTGKVYIGQSSNVQTRIKWYKRCAPDQPAIYNSIKKYGYENHQFKILVHGLSKESADNVEIELIKLYRRDKISLNIADGGSNGTTMGSKKIYQFTLQGDFIKEYESITSAAKDLGVDIGSVCNVLYGRSKRCKEFIFSFSEQTVPYKKYGKKVYQYDFDNNLLKVWDSIVDLSNFLNEPLTSLYKKVQRPITTANNKGRCRLNFNLSYEPIFF